MEDRITFDEMIRLDNERRKRENPWTAADEARVSAKREQERAALAAWEAKNPHRQDEDEEEDES
jgi:hypothetical protein